MKSLIAFSCVILQDLGNRCGVSTERDQNTVTSRCEHEGISFLTISLPQFGKAFERALDLGAVTDDLFLGYARTGGLPRFLGGFLRLVFDAKSGVLLDVPNVEAVSAIRQFTLMMAKIELPCSEERERAAYAKYVECEQDLTASIAKLEPFREEGFRLMGRSLFRDLFASVDLAVYNHELVPKHGPGSTAERLLGNQKYNLREWTERLDAVFPVGEFLLPSWRHAYLLDEVTVLEPGEEKPVRVISVPKTLKTPRIIAVEPTCMQYMQQALMAPIVEGIEGSDTLHALIGFTDQLPNREMARQGSIHGDLATLDLSEASDRVSSRLVAILLENHPHLSRGVFACRSTKADVPGYGVLPLAKFASMGSALCFPFEAMVFTTIILSRIARELSTSATSHFIRSMRGKVRVYGDDIIVPVEFVSAVSEELEAFGLKVNLAKSFGTGKFRESCGGDYYSGQDVTPVRVRSTFPTSLRHVDELVSTTSLRNQLFEKHLPLSVAFLDRLVGRVLPVYPEVPVSSSALGRHTYEPLTGSRMCKDLQRPLVKACVVKNVTPRDNLDDVGALHKFFLQRGVEPLAKDHLERAGRVESARITTRWVPIVHYGKVA